MVVVLCCMQLHHKGVSVLLVTKFMCCSFFKALNRLLSYSKRYSKQNPHFCYTIN